MNLKINIPTTPGPLYDQEQVYKFTETPTSSEKLEMLYDKTSPDATRHDSKQIWPPPPKLRAASSMLTLNMSNGETPRIGNKLSQSSFYLNKVSLDDSGLEGIKTKRKKWYKMFMPPAKLPKEKLIKEVTEDQPEIISEPKEKRPWYKIKKKKNKQKQKIPVACES